MHWTGDCKMYNVDHIRTHFPILHQKVNGHPLVYLDNAATTHKPISVIDSIINYNKTMHSNPHRSSHALSVMTTQAFDDVREKVKCFIGAKSTSEIVFTRGATESINLVSYSYGLSHIQSGDEIVLSILEHHSNILPWQMVAKAKGAVLRYIYLDSEGRIDKQQIESVITHKTKLIAITHMSNALGTITPIQDIVQKARKVGAKVLVDGAQSVPHMKVDVFAMDIDFFVFSGHKMLAPMGVGVLYAKQELYEQMPPFLTGGSMIEYVQEQEATFAELPHKFEAGTQNAEGVVGLGSAIDYIENLGLENIQKHESELTQYALERLQSLNFIEIYGPKNTLERGGAISFGVKDVHPHDVASILDNDGIAIRAGHHCVQPLMTHLKIPGTNRMSFYLYNTKTEIDLCIESLRKVRKWLGYGS